MKLSTLVAPSGASLAIYGVASQKHFVHLMANAFPWPNSVIMFYEVYFMIFLEIGPYWEVSCKSSFDEVTLGHPGMVIVIPVRTGWISSEIVSECLPSLICFSKQRLGNGGQGHMKPIYQYVWRTWAPSQYEDPLSRYGIPVLKIRELLDCLMFT